MRLRDKSSWITSHHRTAALVANCEKHGSLLYGVSAVAPFDRVRQSGNVSGVQSGNVHWAEFDRRCGARTKAGAGLFDLETPDRRSPPRLLDMIQETIGLLNQPAMTRRPSVESMGWSGDQPTSRIGIKSKRKTKQGGDLRSAVSTGSRDGQETLAERGQAPRTEPVPLFQLISGSSDETRLPVIPGTPSGPGSLPS
jgi:hypothetical protein